MRHWTGLAEHRRPSLIDDIQAYTTAPGTISIPLQEVRTGWKEDPNIQLIDVRVEDLVHEPDTWRFVRELLG